MINQLDINCCADVTPDTELFSHRLREILTANPGVLACCACYSNQAGALEIAAFARMSTSKCILPIGVIGNVLILGPLMTPEERSPCLACYWRRFAESFPTEPLSLRRLEIEKGARTVAYLLARIAQNKQERGMVYVLNLKTDNLHSSPCFQTVGCLCCSLQQVNQDGLQEQQMLEIFKGL